MKVHITNLYGFYGLGATSQNAVTAVAKKYLQYNELGIYHYPMKSDSPEMLRTRMDGILAAVGHGDVVIMQSPTWLDFAFDERFMAKLNNYRGLKKIVLLHDVPPLMFEFEPYISSLNRYIQHYNQADLIIVPSQNMADLLISNGLIVKKVVVQRMWDFMVSVDRTIVPPFKKVINLAGNPSEGPKLAFARNWKYHTVQLAVTADGGEWARGKNVSFLGWFQDETILANALRKNGGFGLMWSEYPFWCEYMKRNATYKFSTYLAAGIPVIVPAYISEADTVIRKNLGFAVESLDEAIEKIESMNEEQYRNMVADVGAFSELIRGGYFAKKMLTDAVFEVLQE